MHIKENIGESKKLRRKDLMGREEKKRHRLYRMASILLGSASEAALLKANRGAMCPQRAGV
jgi:hypothetical protein